MNQSFEEELEALARDFLAGRSKPIDPEAIRKEILEAELHAADVDQTEREIAPLLFGHFISGAPAAFAAGERTRAWQERLSEAIPRAPDWYAELYDGFIAEFAVPAPTATRPGYDLDNLLDPVFSRLINAQGWCGGRRPRVRWVAARKYAPADGEQGIRLRMSRRMPDTWIDRRRLTAVDEVFHGPLPKRGQMGEYTEWVKGAMRRQLEGIPLGIELRFSSSTPNLGDIADGPVKAMIDGLWPVMGGTAQAPFDHSVERLLVEKNVGGEGGVRVRVIECRG